MGVSAARSANAGPRSRCRFAGHALAVLAISTGALAAGCRDAPERKRHPSEVAPVQTRDTTLGRPSVSGGSAAGFGTSEPDK